MDQHNQYNPDDARFIWIDVETDSIDPATCELFEVACIVTDGHLHEGGRYEAALWHPRPETIYERVDPFILKMHGGAIASDVRGSTEPGSLFRDLQYATTTKRDAETALLKLFVECGVPIHGGVVAGATVHYDKAVLKRHMPLLDTFFNHRCFDVSTLSTAARLWHPTFMVGEHPTPGHRAMTDIEGSLHLARKFRSMLFRTMEDQAIASRSE